MTRLFLLSLACLCAESYWVGHISAPYGKAGLIYSFSILIAGASFGGLAGWAAAKTGG